MSKISPLKRYILFTQKLCLDSFLVSMACLSMVQATRDEFVNATPRQRLRGWENIENHERHFIECSIDPSLVVSAPTAAGQSSFTLKEVRCDGIKLTSTSLPNETRYRGDIHGITVDLGVTFRTIPANHQLEIQEIRDYTNSSADGIQLPLTNIIHEHGFDSDRIIRPMDPEQDPDFSTLHRWLARQPMYRAYPQICIKGRLSDYEIEIDFEQEEALPLQLSEVLYVKDSNLGQDGRLGVFGKIGFPGGSHFFELVRWWNLNNREDLQALAGEVFYDGNNIYTSVSTRTWVDNWKSGSNFQLSLGDQEKLRVMTLHFRDPQPTWDSNKCWEVINPTPIGQVSAISVGRYRLNNRHNSEGVPIPQEIPNNGAVIYSDGASCCRFLAQRYIQVWDSIAEPATSYDIETFSNTGISLIFDALQNGPPIWPEGTYFLSNPQGQKWKRKFSPHGSESYRVTPKQGSNNITIAPEKPTGMAVGDYLDYLSHFPLMKIEEHTDPMALESVQPDTDILTIRRSVGPKIYLPDVTRLLTSSSPSLAKLKVLTLKIPLETLVWKNACNPFEWGDDKPDEIVSRFATTLAQLSSLNTLNVVFPPISGYARDVAKGGATVGFYGGLGLTVLAVLGGVAIPALVIGGTVFTVGGTAVGAGTGAAVGGVCELATRGESYPQYLDFGRELGKSLSLRQITFFGVPDDHNRMNIWNAVNEGRTVINAGRSPQLPHITVEFE
jgi:hypothetical protein